MSCRRQSWNYCTRLLESCLQVIELTKTSIFLLPLVENDAKKLSSIFNTIHIFRKITNSVLWELYGYVYQTFVKVIPILIIATLNILMMLKMRVMPSFSWKYQDTKEYLKNSLFFRKFYKRGRHWDVPEKVWFLQGWIQI